ncbi:MAG: hypothetical protein ACLUVG_05705 [Phocaeicola vulgatus]
MSPQKAFEYAGEEEGDKYFKVWMVGVLLLGVLGLIQWLIAISVGMLRREMKTKEITRTFLGNEPYVSAYLKSSSAIERCSVVYMFPFEAFSQREGRSCEEGGKDREYK